MTRYYFNVIDEIETSDSEGAEFPRYPSCRRAGEPGGARPRGRIREAARASVLSHRMQIEDEQGETVALVRFGDAVDIRP